MVNRDSGGRESGMGPRAQERRLRKIVLLPRCLLINSLQRKLVAIAVWLGDQCSSSTAVRLRAAALPRGAYTHLRTSGQLLVK